MEILSLEQLQSGKLKTVKRISISNGLTHFPEEIFDHTETLEILDLSNNLLSEIPETIIQFKKLKILFLSNNNFKTFPLVLGQCKALTMIGFKSNQINFIPENAFPVNLQWLILTNNAIPSLPNSIGKCLHLQKVALAGNRLTDLPKEMANCINLELLRISANQFKELPTWLLNLPKLAWLAFSGNPCSTLTVISKPLTPIDWNHLSVKEQLGEGASGIISKVLMKSSSTDKEEKFAAVKVFKGEVTSDGFPEDEMNISAIIPPHKNIVSVIGKIYNHPQNKDGLVLKLIPKNFHNLGMPPSFETCSRDIFKPNTIFSLNDIIKIVTSIGDAAFELHAKDIMHGDLYAHNILIDEQANSLFGDFGAATLYNHQSSDGILLERIEVRAFGYLMEDLLNHLDNLEKQLPAVSKLTELKEDCLIKEILLRPDFKFINTQLKKLN